jgi:hypothetical protein
MGRLTQEELVCITGLFICIRPKTKKKCEMPSHSLSANNVMDSSIAECATHGETYCFTMNIGFEMNTCPD